MTRNDLNREYFDWLFDLVCRDRYSPHVSFRKLLTYLHNTEFKYVMHNDKTRAEEGIYLRYRFAVAQGYKGSAETIADCLGGPCSIFEMMVGLAMHIEENIMDDPSIGDRTGQWFWEMITSMGLGSMHDSRFDRWYVEKVIDRFLNRDYEPNGRGGLFTIRRCPRDLRDAEIWHQTCLYLGSIT